MNMSIHAAEDVVAKILSEHVEASKCHTEMTGTIFILFDVRSRKKVVLTLTIGYTTTLKPINVHAFLLSPSQLSPAAVYDLDCSL